HGRVTDHVPARQGEAARHRVGGADESTVDECTDGAAGFEQSSDLPGFEACQSRETDHGGAEHVGRGDEVGFAVEHADVGGHPDIMSRDQVGQYGGCCTSCSRYPEAASSSAGIPSPCAKGHRGDLPSKIHTARTGS